MTTTENTASWVPTKQSEGVLLSVTQQFNCVETWLTWTVHWLQPKLLLLDIKTEHVLLVVVGVAGGLPQVKVIDVGRHHFLILKVPVYLPDELHADNIDR